MLMTGSPRQRTPKTRSGRPRPPRVPTPERRQPGRPSTRTHDARWGDADRQISRIASAPVGNSALTMFWLALCSLLSLVAAYAGRRPHTATTLLATNQKSESARLDRYASTASGVA